MERLEWNKVLDGYLSTAKMTSEDYENCDDLQKYVIQQLKKSFSRLNKGEINQIHHSLQINEKNIIED